MRRAMMIGVMACVVSCVVLVPWQGEAGYHHGTHAAGVRVAPDLEVLGVEVGSFEYDRARAKVVFTPASRLEMIPGKTYGWRLKLNTTRRQIAWVETMALPSTPAHWGISSHVTLSFDRTTATTRQTTEVDEHGYISNYWIFSEGDPAGQYTVRVTIDEVDVATSSVQVY